MKLSSRSPKDYCWDYRKQGDIEKYGLKLYNFLIENEVKKQT